MDLVDARETLDSRIAALEKKLTTLKALREAIADDDVAGEVSDLFSSNGAPPVPKKRQKAGPQPKNLPKALLFFRKNGNAQATVAQISKATKLSKNSVRHMLYHSQKDVFERESHIGAGRESLFRLKPEHLNAKRLSNQNSH
jgi:hypothetical protein